MFNRDHPVTSSKISEAIWGDEEKENQGDKVKSLISRFKKVFSEISEQPLLVSSSQGYTFNLELNIMTDIELFDECCPLARRETDFQKKLELYQKAVALYKDNI